ncbi:hypothetical protein [Lactiplantibacillus plantarum]|uniref:hypothetical protein n=1 Tax=Lactiplantibacillus plantarum TaxID=1590 RepID=UPI0022370818|nr:hypothetical protein [Lactiplantibacillus plantarum]MCW6133181.1 hypothetical protein [Lactiplantibacillus plantarum]
MKKTLCFIYNFTGFIISLLFLYFRGVSYGISSVILFAAFFALFNFERISTLSLTTNGLTIKKVTEKITELRELDSQITSVYTSILRSISLDTTAAFSGGMTADDYLNLYKKLKETSSKIKNANVDSEMNKIERKLIYKLLLEINLDSSRGNIDSSHHNAFDNSKNQIYDLVGKGRYGELIPLAKKIIEEHESEMNEESLAKLNQILEVVSE